MCEVALKPGEAPGERITGHRAALNGSSDQLRPTSNDF
jgi:hypothetical protein